MLSLLALFVGVGHAEDGAAPTEAAPVMQPVIRPVSEVWLSLIGSGLEAGGAPDLAFSITRGAFGADAALGPRVRTRVLANLTQKAATTTASFTTVGGDSGEVQLATFPNGWTASLRDAWAEVAVDRAERLTVRAGVQPITFGVRDSFPPFGGPFYVVGPDFEEVAVVSGLIPGRSVGARASLAIQGGDGSVDFMVTNGGGSVAQGDDNLGKDAVARLAVTVGPDIHLSGSALYGPRGAEGAIADTLASVSARWASRHLALLGEVHGGEVAGEAQSGQTAPVIGLDAAGSTRWDMPGELLESGALVGRFGYYDPHARTVDADAWMLGNVSLQANFPTWGTSGLMAALAYQTVVPMDATAPVSHTAMGQVAWRY